MKIKHLKRNRLTIHSAVYSRMISALSSMNLTSGSLDIHTHVFNTIMHIVDEAAKEKNVYKNNLFVHYISVSHLPACLGDLVCLPLVCPSVYQFVHPFVTLQFPEFRLSSFDLKFCI